MIQLQSLQRMSRARMWRGRCTLVSIVTVAVSTHTLQANTVAVYVSVNSGASAVLFTFDPASPPNSSTRKGFYVPGGGDSRMMREWIPCIGGSTMAFISESGVSVPVCVIEMLDEAAV